MNNYTRIADIGLGLMRRSLLLYKSNIVNISTSTRLHFQTLKKNHILGLPPGLAPGRQNKIFKDNFARFFSDKTDRESGDMEDPIKREASLPNKAWKDEALEFYEHLMKLTESGGDWEKVKSFYQYSETRLFARAIDIPGKQFEYALFINRKEKLLKGVVQLGPWLEGPTGFVHGGAIATLLDIATGVLQYNLGYTAVTVNLNVDYVKVLPLNSVVEVVAWMEKVDGRKLYIKGEIKSLDGKTLYDKTTALFLVIPSNYSNYSNKDIVKGNL